MHDEDKPIAKRAKQATELNSKLVAYLDVHSGHMDATDVSATLAAMAAKYMLAAGVKQELSPQDTVGWAMVDSADLTKKFDA